MSTDKTPEDQMTEAGAVELDETQLDKVEGGAIGVIAVSHEVKATGGQAAFVDGSVRFVQQDIG